MMIRFLIICLVCLLTSCASITTLDSGRTIGKGNFGGAIALSTSKGFSPDRGYWNANDSIPQTASFAEFNFIYGIGRRTDLHLRVGALGIPSAGVKYQFYGDNNTKWSSSIGLNTGYINIGSGYYRTHVVNISIPIYVSYLLSDKVTAYTVPKYIYGDRLYYQPGQPFEWVSQVDKLAPHSFGLSTGIKIGKKSGILLEYSMSKSSELLKPNMQFAVGIFY